MTEIRCPIVGMKFYPPAIGILGKLPVGTRLLTMAEPTNSYDENAIQVWIETHRMNEATLNWLVSNGMNASELAETTAFQLGHIAASFAKKLKTEMRFPNARDVPGTFVISSSTGRKDSGYRVILDSENWASTEKKKEFLI